MAETGCISPPAATHPKQLLARKRDVKSGMALAETPVGTYWGNRRAGTRMHVLVRHMTATVIEGSLATRASAETSHALRAETRVRAKVSRLQLRLRVGQGEQLPVVTGTKTSSGVREYSLSSRNIRKNRERKTEIVQKKQ